MATINGTNAAETLSSGTGADTINGLDGNDVLYGNAGADRLNGGSGNDTLYGGADNDTLSGDDGDDLLSDTEGANVVSGGNGNDIFENVGYSGGSTAGGVDTLTGGTGRDTYRLHAYDARYSPSTLKTDVITDFAAGIGGDVLELSSVTSFLSGWDSTTSPFAAGYIRAVASGSDTLIQVDWDGTGSSAGWQSLVKLVGVAPSALTYDNFDRSWSPTGQGANDRRGRFLRQPEREREQRHPVGRGG